MKIGGIYLVSDNNSFGIVDFGDETMEIGWPELVEVVGENGFGYLVQDLSMSETFVHSIPKVLFEKGSYTTERQL